MKIVSPRAKPTRSPLIRKGATQCMQWVRGKKKLDPGIWKRYWGFTEEELRVLRMVGAKYAYHGAVPYLESALDLSEKSYIDAASFSRCKEYLKSGLPRGLTIQKLYKLIEPAALFMEIWFYQMCQRTDYPQVKASYKKYHDLVDSVGAPEAPFSTRLKAMLRKEFAAATSVGYPLVDIDREEYKVLQKYMGAGGVAGLELKDPHRKYCVHKAPYWRMALKVLNRYLTLDDDGPHVRDYTAAQISYKFLHRVFPGVFESYLTSKKRRDFVYSRIRHCPKLSISVL